MSDETETRHLWRDLIEEHKQAHIEYALLPPTLAGSRLQQQAIHRCNEAGKALWSKINDTLTP